MQRERNLDIVTGTRYLNGGGVWGWNLKRKLTSRVANYIASCALGKASSDMTGSFRSACTGFGGEAAPSDKKGMMTHPCSDGLAACFTSSCAAPSAYGGGGRLLCPGERCSPLACGGDFP